VVAVIHQKLIEGDNLSEASGAGIAEFVTERTVAHFFSSFFFKAPFTIYAALSALRCS
jgi:hypothetical protein